MGDILNLDIKDDTLNDVISKNPFYIDIKGSVNICLIRCGQEIETCNNITFKKNNIPRFHTLYYTMYLYIILLCQFQYLVLP